MRKYLTKRVKMLALILTVVMLAPAALWAASPAMPGLGSAVFPMTFHLSGQYASSQSNVIAFRAPVALRVLYATAVAKAKGGSNVTTSGASHVQLFNAATAMTTPNTGMDLGNPAAATVAEATLLASQQSVAKDATLSGDLIVWGSGPTLQDITVVIWVQRRN